MIAPGRNDIITDRLWQIKKAAQDIQRLTEDCNQNCNGLHCPLWRIGGGLHCCDLHKLYDMYIPR